MFPLDVPLDVPGKHEYVLDSLLDGLGNIRPLSPAYFSNKGDARDVDARLLKETTRSITVLKRAAMSFRDCAPGKPASLLIGSESPIVITAREYDNQDGPWDVKVKFQPQDSGKDKKTPKPWVKTLTTPVGANQLTLNANAPGEYSIIDVKGKYCPGDILSPEICRVVQQPLPSVEIDWKRIHEW